MMVSLPQNPQWMMITPDIASFLLSKNVEYNRAKVPSKVKEWSEKMRRGAWAVTGSSIDFDVNGRMINGQHRLQAVIDSGTTQQFLVVPNLPTEAFDHTDIGATRSAAMVFGRYLSEETNRNVKVAAARTMLMGVINSTSPDKDTIVRFAVQNIGIINAALTPLMTMNSVHRRAPTVAAFANAMRKSDDEWTGPKGGFAEKDVMPHLIRYGTQMWSNPHDPMKALYDRIQRAATSRAVGENLAPLELYGMSVAALRACLRGDETLRVLYSTTVDWGQAKSKSAQRASDRVRRLKKRPQPELFEESTEDLGDE